MGFQIKDLNVRPKTIKVTEKNISGALFDISLHNFFLLRQGKQKQNQWDCIKLEIFCTMMETINKMKKAPAE